MEIPISNIGHRIYGGINTRLYNPIWQNDKHIKFLKMILSDNQYPIYPAIVFLNTSSIRLTGDGDCVLHKNKLRSYISKYRNILMSIEDCKRIANFLLNHNITDRKERKAHIHYVKQSARKKEIMADNGRCPRCGGILIQRHGRYGTFWGCSNYPNCKFTK